MKKRILVLALALMMMLSVAAPVMAAGDDEVYWDGLYLGQILTVDELVELVEAEALAVFHAKYNGAMLEGIHLNFYGEARSTYRVTPNVLVFIDADGLCSLVRVVELAGGGFALQVYAQGSIDADELTPLEVLLTVDGWGTYR